MIQLPRLLSELIGWYIWKTKISEFNTYFLQKQSYLYDGVIKVSFPYVCKIYGSRVKIDRYSQPFILNKNGIRVALLPQKYYYSSGSNNQNGFLPKFENKYNWLIPNIP